MVTVRGVLGATQTRKANILLSNILLLGSETRHPQSQRSSRRLGESIDREVLQDEQMTVSWNPGAANDCTVFLRWKVEVRKLVQLSGRRSGPLT